MELSHGGGARLGRLLLLWGGGGWNYSAPGRSHAQAEIVDLEKEPAPKRRDQMHFKRLLCLQLEFLGQCCQLVRSLDYPQDFRAGAEWNESMVPVSALMCTTHACLLGKGLGIQQSSPLPSSAAVSLKKGSATQWADGGEIESYPCSPLQPHCCGSGRPGQSLLPSQLCQSQSGAPATPLPSPGLQVAS